MRFHKLVAACVLEGSLVCGAAEAATTKSIPVVAQIQGTTFFRTSVTISNSDDVITTPVRMTLSYRSPVDNTFQITTLDLNPPLGPRRVRVFEDIIQAFKDAGRIRQADANALIFGTLLVTFDTAAFNEDNRHLTAAVARTYSALSGGTVGIAYAGRCFCLVGSQGRVTGAARSGAFGNDGTTRANLGIVNEGDFQNQGPTDVRVRYYNGETGQLLKDFLISDLVHRPLDANEVHQLNNIFADPAIPPTVHTLAVQVEAVSADWYVSAYVVQIDATTTDGSFFFLEEE